MVLIDEPHELFKPMLRLETLLLGLPVLV